LVHCGGVSYNASYSEGVNRRITVQASLGIKVRPYSEVMKAKRASDMVQVVKHLSSKHKILRNTSNTK
jgi:hypothetical protein